jgi:hypothetical protein
MAEIHVPTLLKDCFFLVNGEVTGVDISSVYFLQICISHAVWKDKTEAEMVLKMILKIAEHENVTDDSSLCGDLPKMVLRCIKIAAQAVREFEHQS